MMYNAFKPMGKRIRTLDQQPYAPVKSNMAAVVAPGVGDDLDDGYAVGSIWIDIVADNAYMCVDATVGAAVWKQIT